MARLRQIHEQAEKYRKPEDTRPIAEVLRPIMLHKLAAQAAQPKTAQAIVEWIMREVNDPKLSKARCHKIAWAVVKGLYPESDLASVLKATQKAVPKSPDVSAASARGKYFNRTMTIVFEKLGIDLADKKPDARVEPTEL